MKPITNLKAISLGRRDVFTVDPVLITDIQGLNERTDYGDIETLKDQIKEHGVIDDLIVRIHEGKLGLVEGYRRMRCVRELIAEKAWKHGGVPVKAEPKDHTEVDRLIRQIVGNEGKPYNILEEGRVFERLLSLDIPDPKTKKLRKFTKTEVGRETGKSRTHVSNALALASAPPAVLTLVEEKKIAGSLVIDLIHEIAGNAEIPEADKPARLVAAVTEAIENAGKSGKTKASRKHTTPKKPKDPTPPDPTPALDQSALLTEAQAKDLAAMAPFTDEDRSNVCDAYKAIQKEDRATVPFLQRRLKWNWSRASRIIAILQSIGILGQRDIDDPALPLPILLWDPADAAQINARLKLLDPISETSGTNSPPQPEPPTPAHNPLSPALDAPQNHIPPGAGGGGGPQSTSYDTTTNLRKLNTLMENLERNECDPKCYDTIECVIDFLQGKRTTAEVKHFIKA